MSTILWISKSSDNTTIERADTATLPEHCAYTVQEIPEPEHSMNPLAVHMQKSGNLQLIQTFKPSLTKTLGI
jgi:hypothetical protein